MCLGVNSSLCLCVQVLEHVDRTLSRELTFRPRGLPAPQIRLIAWQLLQALDHLHQRQVSDGCTLMFHFPRHALYLFVHPPPPHTHTQTYTLHTHATNTKTRTRPHFLATRLLNPTPTRDTRTDCTLWMCFSTHTRARTHTHTHTHTHTQIIHRDLKPANILLSSEGVVK